MENPYRSDTVRGENRDPKALRNTRLFQVIVIVFAFYVLLGNGAFYGRVFASLTTIFADGGIGGLFPYALTFAMLTLLGVVLIAITFSYTFHRDTLRITSVISALVAVAAGALTYVFYAEIRGAWIALMVSLA